MAWIVAALLLVVCVSVWSGWSSTAARLRHAEQMWVELFEQSDQPTRLLALNSLGQFGPLSPSTLEKLRAATKGESDDIRIASLAALALHASECRSFQFEIFKIQNTDDSPAVRAQASRTYEAMQRTNGQSRGGAILFWCLIAAIVGSMIAAGGWLWLRLRKFA